MTPPAPPARIEFSGSVECRRGSGALLSLMGSQAGAPFSVHLATTAPAELQSLPALLQDVRLLELPSPGDGLRAFELRARGLRQELQARGVQVHRDVAREFFAAVPPVPVPALRRAAWSMLLALLRIPGFIGLLKRLRGAK